MAAEAPTATSRSSEFLRRLRERADVWRRLFLANWGLFKASRIGVIGLAIMIAFVILALAAPFMGLRDPIRWTAPDQDLIDVAVFWAKDSSLPGSEFRGMAPVNHPLAFRVLSAASDPRADRVYVTATNRLYALETQPNLRGANAWFTTFVRYFDVTEGTDPTRTITASPLLMNYGDYTYGPADYEIYLGTSDGTLFILRDIGDTVPAGTDVVAKLSLDGSAITGLAAYTGDDQSAFPGSASIATLVGNANLVTSPDGENWTTYPVPGSTTSDQGESASLAIDSSGSAHVAYYDYRNGRPFIATRNASWTFRPVEPYAATVNNGPFTSLALGTDQRQRVAYYDETDRTLKYASWNGTAFNPRTVDVGGVGEYASLALDSFNHPRIAYYNASGALKYAWSNDEITWTTETVDQPFVGRFASLALDPAGNPHIAYYDDARQALKYANWTGAWTNTTVDVGGVGQYASLALDPFSNAPSIAYFNATSGTLKYANWTGAWTNTTVDAATNVGMYASLAFRATVSPAIAYHDATNLDLKYATWDVSTRSWTDRTIASAGNVGLYNSLKFDAGRPRIAYHSYQTGRTAKDLVVAGTAAGGLYAIDVSIPKSIDRSLPRLQSVSRWDYRIRWQANLGSEVHLAAGPQRAISAVPAFSPAFDRNGTSVFSGTQAGDLVANRTMDGTASWPAKKVRVGAGWTTAPVVQIAVEDEPSVKGSEIVYAASGLHADGLSLLFARFAADGTIPPQWQVFADGGAPVGPSPASPDGGNLTQPTIEGGIVYVGSDSGYLYALRGYATPPAIPFPASVVWDYRDPTLIGLRPKFESPPLVRNAESLLLVTANENNGTAADPTDDRGVLYSIKLDGNVSWRKTFPSVIPGTPVAWNAPQGLGLAVFVGYGNPRGVEGVSSLAASGRFLAPSEPSWAHSYSCPPPIDRKCPGYPSGNQYWLGLDSQGRDIFSQVIWGSRIALLVGFLAAFFSVVIGVVVGLIAGYVGGKTEAVLMRFTDVILVLPGLPLIIAMAAVLGASIWNIILVISLLGWPGIARIIRAEVLSLKERPFIDSARVTGASTTRIVFKHIAPNVMPLAFLYMTFSVSGAILAEAALSFIGLGDVRTMSWGIMLQLVSQSKALQAWWWLLPPGLAITLISLAFFLIGRAFDEIVNPRLRKR